MSSAAPSIGSEEKLSLSCDQIAVDSRVFAVKSGEINLKTDGVQLALNSEKVNVGTP